MFVAIGSLVRNYGSEILQFECVRNTTVCFDQRTWLRPQTLGLPADFPEAFLEIHLIQGRAYQPMSDRILACFRAATELPR